MAEDTALGSEGMKEELGDVGQVWPGRTDLEQE